MSRGNLKKMENFSKFFDSIISSNNSNEKPQGLAPATNNDNNIYNSINNINSSDTKTFPSEDYYLLANEIILGATKLHKKLYDDLTVPYIFISFYMTQFATYTDEHGYYLKKFLILFNNKKNNIANAINIFSRAYPKDSAIKLINKNSHLPQLKQSYYLEVSKSLSQKTIGYSEKIDNNLRFAITQTRKIIDTIDATAKEKNFNFNYLEYITQNNVVTNVQTVASQSTPQTPPETKTRKVIAPPKQPSQEKISNITLPKLKIGKVYPTSFTHSRIDSAYFTHNFLEGHRLYTLVQKYRFIKVKYTDGFEAKRKSLFEVKKSTFDLF